MSNPVMMILYLFLLSGISCSLERAELDRLWMGHKKKYSLTFGRDEELRRKLIFKENVDFINQFNSEERSSHLKANMFAHYTDEEMDEMYGTTADAEPVGGQPMTYDGLNDESADTDWRDSVAVTHVRNTGLCIADYAFAAIGVVEGRFKIVNKKLVIMSEQDIIDCSFGKTYGNRGCAGGDLISTFRYMSENGVLTAYDYDYVKKEGDCKHNLYNITARPKGYYFLKDQSEKELAFTVEHTGPVANGIRLSKEFRFHEYGILNVTRPCSKVPNFALLTIGIGSDPYNYYVVKNSWGHDWGEQGFGRIIRDEYNMCGIATWGVFIIFI